MAMDEEMRCLGHRKVTGKGKEQLDVPALGSDPAGLRFDHIVKAQPEAPVDAEPVQGLRLGPSGVKYREDMRYASGAMALQLVDPANRHLEWHQLLHGHRSFLRSPRLEHQSIARLWQICARSVGPVENSARRRTAPKLCSPDCIKGRRAPSRGRAPPRTDDG